MTNEKQSNTESGNREYKSDLFSMLMQEKEYALETYNAINGSDYQNPEDIEIITLEHGVALSIRNDASFIVDMNVNYYEHQSTYNPNMPIRSLIYYVEDLRKQFVGNRDLYSRRRIQIPTPHFVVFYNGIENVPEKETQKLSMSFLKEAKEPDLELNCHVYNINPGMNHEIKEKAKVLSSYTYFVENVRELAERIPLKDAIAGAIDLCIQKGILKDFLLKHRSEVEKNMILDYTFEKRLEYTARDEHEAGREEGMEKLQSAFFKIKNGVGRDDLQKEFDSKTLEIAYKMAEGT